MPRLLLSPVDHVIGDPAVAAVQLVAYGDYACPYTARGMELVRLLAERWGDGLLFAYRHFPLTAIHRDALGAAIAAEAAARQGRFWDMHVRLLTHQGELGPASLTAHAAALGLDPARFARDLGVQTCRGRVRRDRATGEELGVESTPTFFVEGELYDGPVEQIVELVEARLGGGEARP